jgi:hypothetical protein
MVYEVDAKRFLDQFRASRAEVKRLKVEAPHLFHEWRALKAAEEDFAQAKERLALAQQRWRDL